MIVVQCRYCPKNFPIDTNGAFKVLAPQVNAMRLTCPHCGCKMALDLKLRKKGKSAAIRKREVAEKKAWLERGRDLFEQSEAAGSGQTWSSLSAYDQKSWGYRAAWKSK